MENYKVINTYSLSAYPKKCYINPEGLAYDYIRYSFLDLIIDQIVSKCLSGELAELGVYRGDFSSKINAAFSDKRLYLFDTFESFPGEDVEYDKKNINKGSVDLDNLRETFKDTSVEFVLNRMKYKENCIVKKGRFPDTAKGIEERFCLASIDTDLYLPTKEGLNFFYPKLVENGYILIHDYNNDGAPGVKQATDEWCRKNGISLIPIPDQWGTVIITKNKSGFFRNILNTLK